MKRTCRVVLTFAAAIFSCNSQSANAQDYYQETHSQIGDHAGHSNRSSTAPRMQDHQMAMPLSPDGGHSGMQMQQVPMQDIQHQAPDKPGHRYQTPSAMPIAPEASSPTDSPQSYSGQQLTLEDLIALATENNPTLRQAQNQITAETGKAIQAGLYPNPTLRYSAEQIGVDGTAGEFHGGILGQEIVRGRKLQLSRAKFQQRVKAAEAMALAQQFRVCNDVRIHFYQSLALQQQVHVQTELTKSAEDASVTAREAYQMGQANAVDIRRSNVSLQKSRLELLARQNKRNQSMRRLSALVNVNVEGSMLVGELEGQPIALDFNELLSGLIANSPEMLAANCKLQADRFTVRREIAEPIPNVRLEGGAGYNFERDETVAVAGVSITLPVWDRNQGTIRQAKADLARQCSELERLKGRLKRDLAQQYEQYMTTSQHVSQYQQTILPELKETYRLLLEGYKSNRTNWNEVLLAQNDYFTARSEYLDWLAQWRQSEVLIDGMLLHGGLMAAEGPFPAGHIDSVAKPR